MTARKATVKAWAHEWRDDGELYIRGGMCGSTDIPTWPTRKAAKEAASYGRYKRIVRVEIRVVKK